MDSTEFPVPSPKRQRTESPHEPREDDAAITRHKTEQSIPDLNLQATSAHDVTDISQNSSIRTVSDNKENEQATPIVSKEDSILDTLMQHVEAESHYPDAQAEANRIPTNEPIEKLEPKVEETKTEPLSLPGLSAEDASQEQPSHHVQDVPPIEDIVMEEDPVKHTTIIPDTQILDSKLEQTQITPLYDNNIPAGLPVASDETVARLQAAAEVDGIPPTSDILAVQVEGTQEREWETDSSPYESSDSDSTDSSEDDSSDDDEDAEGDYAMLDAEEQARILMQDAGSDDEGERNTGKGQSSGLRTANEKVEEIIPKPDITITEEMHIEELGAVEAVIEGTVLVKAKVSGEYQVLESGSLLCLKDRTVLGVVGETLGRVEQPLYTIRFTNVESVQESGVSEKGTAVYYVHGHSTFVFTQPLKAVKGSDASNFHDEEVGDEEMEFSDDEAEAEHKRQLKLKRRGLNPDTARGRGSMRGGRGNSRGRGGHFQQHMSDVNGTAYGNGSLEMNYDDVDAGEEGYTPLSRPTNLHEMMGSNQPVEEPKAPSQSLPPFPPMRSGRGRGRGGNDRGRGNRGNQRGGRGGFNSGGHNSSNNSNHTNNNNYQSYPNPYNQQNQQQQQQQQQQQPYPQNNYQSLMGAAPHQFSSFPPPPPPQLTPQSGNYSTPFSPSPISPLPTQQYNFGAYPGQPQQQQQHHQQNYIPPMLGNHFPQHFFGSAQQQQQQQQQNGNMSSAPPAWQDNQAAAAQVQRQLEELRRAMGNAGANNGGNGGQ